MVKDGLSPAGTAYTYQGFENHALIWNLKNENIDESMIVNNPDQIPVIEYEYDGTVSKYLTDILIYNTSRPGNELNTKKNSGKFRFHECKSTFTAFHCKPYIFKINAAKRRGCIKNGIMWECGIFDEDGSLIMLFGDPNSKRILHKDMHVIN